MNLYAISINDDYDQSDSDVHVNNENLSKKAFILAVDTTCDSSRNYYLNIHYSFLE